MPPERIIFKKCAAPVCKLLDLYQKVLVGFEIAPEDFPAQKMVCCLVQDLRKLLSGGIAFQNVSCDVKPKAP